VRVVIADDMMLIRSGLARLLGDAGIDVVGEAADSEELMKLVALERPDVAVVDIRMPPTQTDEGLVAARRIRDEWPDTSVLLLSQHLDSRYAQRLFADQPAGLGYLLKERVSNVAVLVDALRRVSEEECVLDPSIVAALMRRRRSGDLLGTLTARESEVLELIAEGRSNQGVAEILRLSERTVEATSAAIFRKLGLEHSRDSNRRVLAVLALLRS
jgi:DNA-binding NarL/FixJ family response regulator